MNDTKSVSFPSCGTFYSDKASADEFVPDEMNSAMPKVNDPLLLFVGVAEAYTRGTYMVRQSSLCS